MKTFRIGGVKIYWSATYEDQQAWRCITRGRRQTLLQSAVSISGDDGLASAKQRRDALNLARVVAYAQPVR
jgi:hypothetical protein